MQLLIVFSTTFRIEYTLLLSTLLGDCSVNVLSKMSAAFACFIPTRGMIHRRRPCYGTESIMSSSVRKPETTMFSSISTKYLNGSSE